MGTALQTESASIRNRYRSLPKSPTGIAGLDEITGGGLPSGRPTLISGNAGCGKTLFSLEFLVHGAEKFGEPGVFLAFEETEPELIQNIRSLGYDLDELVSSGKLAIDHVHIERSEIEETGEYDLEGLFIRLGHAIDSIGAKRVVLDTLESLFGGLSNPSILRAELRRLFRWLKERGMTTIITAERGDGELTRHGLEEYVSDCVILLDHRVVEQIATRRIRIVKYRGTVHGTNEYPFLIDDDGIEVLPVTSAGLDHQVSDERISTGVPALDEMLGGQGLYRGSSLLVTGTAGTGKTSLTSHIVDAACRRGEQCLFLTFEESAPQLIRNMRSIGIDLQRWMDAGLLDIHAARPTLHGLEAHLATIHRRVRNSHPSLVAIDPITTFSAVGTSPDVKSMLMRLADYLKSRQITGVFNSLTHETTGMDSSDVGLSSLMDTWLQLRNFEEGREFNRSIHVLKSRGMPHSNQVREFVFTGHGIGIVDVYRGPGGVLTGTDRVLRQKQDRDGDRRKPATGARTRASAAKDRASRDGAPRTRSAATGRRR